MSKYWPIVSALIFSIGLQKRSDVSHLRQFINVAQYSAKGAGRSVKPLSLTGLERYQGVPPFVFTSIE
jgi:hypothetical protein